MTMLFQALFLAFALIVPVYLFAVWKLHGMIRLERPDWLRGEGSLGFFYRGMPSLANPNVGVDVLRVAFSSRRLQLSAPAMHYAQRIRVLLPLGVAIFLIIFVWAALRQQP